MPQSFCQIYCHLVFSTKNREKTLKKEIQETVHKYLAGLLRKKGSEYVLVGGVSDHVHILFQIPKQCAPIEMIETLKKDSSKFVKTLGPDYQKFYWQKGYGMFSIGHTQLDTVKDYILNQETHHKKMSFKQEIIKFLTKYGIEYNEEYLWD